MCALDTKKALRMLKAVAHPGLTLRDTMISRTVFFFCLSSYSRVYQSKLASIRLLV